MVLELLLADRTLTDVVKIIANFCNFLFIMRCKTQNSRSLVKLPSNLRLSNARGLSSFVRHLGQYP